MDNNLNTNNVNNEVNTINNELNTNSPKEAEKKDNKIIIYILVILLVGVIGFIGYEKIFSKETPSEPTPTFSPSPVPTDNVKGEYAEWMTYLLNQNITKIEAINVPCDPDNYDEINVVLNTEQLKNVFKKFMNYKLQVAYVGGGGWTCGEELNIKYQKNGTEYELRYLGSEGHIIPSSDGCSKIYDTDLETALNNSVDVKVNEEAKGQEYVCTMYSILTDSFLLDDYFK